MDTLGRHEVSAIEVLDKLNSAKLLDPLVFGGDTMLRLCHELNRYSVDLDFWFVTKTAQKAFFDKLLKTLEQDYEITDAQIKHFTLLVEVRTNTYPKRLKVEIRREQKECDYQSKIAFSRFSTKHCFDIEFMLRRGIALPELSGNQFNDLRKKADGFKEKDFKVKLGSIVDSNTRVYYAQNRFSYLMERLSAISSGAGT